MRKSEVDQLNQGIYLLHWIDDAGTSFAAVGSLHDGTRWFAPVNWTANSTEGIASCNWTIVKKVEKLVSAAVAVPQYDSEKS